MSDNKQSRLDRELDSREVTFQRQESWRPPDLLPTPNPRPGWNHRYVRTSTLNEADARNISSKLREGYEPCKASDYPELMMHANQEGILLA